MTFRLQHRHTFEPLSVTHTLSLKAPRLSTPEQWDWVWPLHTISADADQQVSSDSKSPRDTLSTLSPVRHVWMSAIRTIAVSDDASFIAFVSHYGAVAVARLNTGHPPTSLVPPPYLPPPAAHDWCSTATALAFFEIDSPSSNLSNCRTILSVGYKSGVVAFYDPSTAVLIAITKAHESQPVRRLKFYTALHYPPGSERITYPRPSTNSALFALLGFNGLLARITSEEISALLVRPSPVVEPFGAGWVLWNLSAQPAVFDIVVCGSTPSPIFEFDNASQTAPQRIIVAGLSPPLTVFSVTPDPAFSARAAAKRAATSVLSAARGFLFPRLSTPSEQGAHGEARTSVTAVARHVASWNDQCTSTFPLPKLTGVPGSAQAITAGLTKSFATANSQPVSSDVSTVLKRVYTPRRAGSDIVRSSQPVHASSQSQRNAVRPASVATIDYDTIRRQSVFASEHHSAKLPRPAKNTRIVERIMAAAPPCSLIASCDSLGRIFIQDPRDFCILRVLKGYRDADVAWMYEDAPILVVLSPRLDILEIHGPLDQKRREAFRVLPGSVLVQSTNYKVFCVFPDGRLFQVTTNKSADKGVGNLQTPGIQSSNEPDWRTESDHVDLASEDTTCGLENSRKEEAERASKYELTGTFVEAVKNGRASQAVECLQKVENNVFLVAHLMATLVACTASVRADVHVAISSKASDIASRLQNPDLVCRFEAHRRLAEAFSLIVVDEDALKLAMDQMRIAKYGPRLLEDDLGAGLTEFGVEELTNGATSAHLSNRKIRTGDFNVQVATCEQFILSHCLVPSVDLSTEGEYQICPRSDLSEMEHIWLAKAYFMKLLELDCVDVPTAGREHPSTADVFLALGEYIGLKEAEIVKHFVLFFLFMPLIPLLNTHVSTYASPLRCAIARIRSQFDHEAVGQIIIDICENTERVANAVLLLRLYRAALDSGEHETGPYGELARRLDEVLIYKRLVAGSNVPRETVEAFTARESSGTMGDAEMHAVTAFIASDEYIRAWKVLNGGPHSIRELEGLSHVASASISEAALYACRRKVANLIDEAAENVLPKNVVSWILEADVRADDTGTLFDNESNTAIFREIRAILLAAHTFIPDSSVDAVRCLQLAEAMSALIDLKKGATSDVGEYMVREPYRNPGQADHMDLDDNLSKGRGSNRKGVFDDISDDLDEEHGTGWEVDSVQFANTDANWDHREASKVENMGEEVNR